MNHPTDLPHAGVGKRLAALIYDSLLLVAISLAYGALALLVAVNLLGVEYAPGEKADLGPVGFVGWLAVLVGFYSFFWRRSGQTLGMKAWRLKLTDDHGRRPGWGRCVLRCALAFISFALLGLGYFWLWFDRDRLTAHDRWSGTRVWQIPKG